MSLSDVLAVASATFLVVKTPEWVVLNGCYLLVCCVGAVGM